jgi:hypothetical protein
MTQVDLGLTSLTRLIRSLALMTVIKNLGRHTPMPTFRFLFSLSRRQGGPTRQASFSFLPGPLPFLCSAGAERDTTSSRASSTPPFYPLASIKSRNPRARFPSKSFRFPFSLPSLCRSAVGH